MSHIKIKKGDKVRVIAGKDKSKEGKVLFVDRKNNRLVIEGVNIIHKHTKPRGGQPGSIVEKEGTVDVSNVMYLHKGKPCRIGYKLEENEKNGKKVITKIRIARPSGEVID